MAKKKKAKKRKHLEIERKFLLKQKPDVKYNIVLVIRQFYCEGRFRARESTALTGWAKGFKVYFKTFKKALKTSVNLEIEDKINKKKFLSMIKTADRKITKRRHIIKHKGLKWEIDVFVGMNLVVAEVELKRVNQRVELPKFIKDNLIMEVTAFKQFSNRNLSKLI